MNENENRLTRKIIIRGTIIFILYLTVLVFLIRYVSNNADIMERIAAAPKELVAFGLLTTALSVTLSAFLDITCAEVYGIKLTVPDAIVFTFIASAINLVIPLQMGSVIKVVYYKRKMALSYSRYLSILSGTVVFSLMASFFVLAFSLFFTMLKWNMDKKYVVLVTIIFLAGLAVMTVVLRLQDKILGVLPFKTYTSPVMKGFFEIFNNKRAMRLCVLNYLLYMVLGGLRFTSIFSILGISAGFEGGMLYFGLQNALSIIPILPGNIGITEAIVGGMHMVLGADFNAGVTTVLLNRIYYYIVALVGAAMSAVPAWILFRKNLVNKDEQ